MKTRYSLLIIITLFLLCFARIAQGRGKKVYQHKDGVALRNVVMQDSLCKCAVYYNNAGIMFYAGYDTTHRMWYHFSQGRKDGRKWYIGGKLYGLDS